MSILKTTTLEIGEGDGMLLIDSGAETDVGADRELKENETESIKTRIHNQKVFACDICNSTGIIYKISVNNRVHLKYNYVILINFFRTCKF